MRVSSTSPGATQLTATSGAMATARQRVRVVQSRLAGGVGNAAAPRADAPGGRDVDDVPATVRLQQIGGRAGQQKWRAQVGLQDTVPDIHGQLVQFGERDPDVPGGVVHKDVQAAMARLNLLNTGFNGCRVPLVQLQVRGFAALVMDGLHGGARGFLGTDIGGQQPWHPQPQVFGQLPNRYRRNRL